MSDPTERPGTGPAGPAGPAGSGEGGPADPAAGPAAPHLAADPDAWATACAEDLAAEKARRRGRQVPPPGSAAEELRKLADAVADRLSSLPLSVAGPAAQSTVQHLVDRARAAVEPVVERNPDVFDHLAAAGSELLAAYRSAARAQERRWTAGSPPAPGTPPAPGAPSAGGPPRPAPPATDPNTGGPTESGGPKGAGRDGGPEGTTDGTDRRDGRDDPGSPPGSHRIDLD
ncbi:DUF5304 domain-containing protein [Streptomyces zingiberis]|uniref:DUF5304 domain-containing protein n=1 Tax=Streptomyces zingiberis TaxID=2053010 RepID=A0ABX1BZ17_9ACTN|nr:DUF5304 domain-containing protein [Streptomyces zingiberis]NJQ02348.1 DUF5304 domain-containing protein [Streptomyces zingiberis]